MLKCDWQHLRMEVLNLVLFRIIFFQFRDTGSMRFILNHTSFKCKFIKINQQLVSNEIHFQKAS